MRLTLGKDIELFLDCVRLHDDATVFLQAWLSWPSDRPMPDILPTDSGQHLPLLLCLPHRRPDIALPPHSGRQVAGIILVFALDPGRVGDAGSLALTTRDRPDEAQIPAFPYGPDVDAMIGQSHWSIVFDLLGAVAARPELHGLLAPQPLGGFSRWHAGLPVLDAAARNVLGLERIEALVAPSGECAICLGLPEPLDPDATLRVLVRDTRHGGAPVMALEGIAELRGDRDITIYGRAELDEHAPAAEFIVELRSPAGSHWFRTSPRLLPAPGFLRALTTLAGGDLVERFTWLRVVLDDREAAFAPRCDRAPDPPRAEAPVVALVEAAADPFMARLILLAAPEIERHAAEVVVFGPREAAEAVADIFLQRGRIPVRTGFDLAAAVRRATYARANLVLIEAEALAAALLEDRIGTLFAHPFHGAALSRLRSLSAIAGTMEGADCLGRLAAAASGRGMPTGARRLRAAGAFAPMIDEHLAALWRRAAPSFGVEGPHGHG